MKHNKINWKVLILSLIAVIVISGIGSISTSEQTNSQWFEINKPSITPPNYVFPIAWSILYFLIALAIYFSYVNLNKTNRKKVMIAYGVNLFFNMLWSILFFSLQKPSWAFIDLVLIWITILYLMTLNWKNSRISSYLLMPYFIWVSFAGILNLLFFI